jgi:hypothetical protein
MGRTSTLTSSPPCAAPTIAPTAPTLFPSLRPTRTPTVTPSVAPTSPSAMPTLAPTTPSQAPSQNPSRRPTRAPTRHPTALAACIVVLSPPQPVVSVFSPDNSGGIIMREDQGCGAHSVVVNAGARLRLAGWSASAGDEATMDRALAWQWNCTNATVVSGSGSGGGALVVDGRPALVTGRFLSWDLPPMTAATGAGPATVYVFTLRATGPAAEDRDQASPSGLRLGSGCSKGEACPLDL